MPDAFDRLIDLVPLTPRTEEPEPGMILVEFDRKSTTGSRAYARVFTEDRPVARLNVSKYVVNLPIKSGEHRVSIRHGREDSAPLLVLVRPAEPVPLVFGQKELWTRLLMRTVIRLVFLPMLGVGITAVIWIVHPFLNAAIEFATNGFGLPAGLASFVHRQSPSRMAATIFAFPIVYLAGIAIIFAWRSREIQRFHAEHGSGISLAIRT